MKRRKVSIRYLRRNIDKIIIALSYCILFIFILTLASRVVIEEKWRERGVWQEYRKIKNDNFIVIYNLNTGENKPTILSYHEDELLAVNGWESTIDVDNVERNFWEHSFRNVSDEKDFILHTMAWENHSLQQVIELQDNCITMEYKFMSSENVSKLTLKIKHLYQKFSEVKVDNLHLSGDNQYGQKKYILSMELSPAPIAMENGSCWFDLIYSLENIAAGDQWHEIAKITMSYLPLKSQ